MTRLVTVSMLALAAASLLESSPVLAQPPGYPPGFGRSPYNRPVISPYTTLLGLEGGDLLGEYYRRVRPEVDLRNAATGFGRSIQGLQTQVRQNRQLIQSGTSQLGPTGHSAWFQTHRKYFGVGR